ncbi:SGNH/GDSL hydrolase family protein [Desulfatirhabdium butyrativorans]|uniref:SGNH/GDSL hydrolase family protein n=1 Tax=Desulfatirhabdium butyrativorans TaxID=340467 RepID=UPI00041ED6A5|nr:SGNH/GDSL hydrolase family protein [Desulfatirhabdium butyrativorans]
MERIYRFGAYIYIIAVMIAIVVQDHTTVLPLGLFNQDRKLYALVSNLCLTVSIVMFVVLTVEFWTQRRLRIGNWIRGCLAFFIITELLVFSADRIFVSGNAKSRLGGPYYERQTSRGTWVILKKPHAGGWLASEENAKLKKVSDRFRILFLGDSYTEGSGHGKDCNYPDVVEKTIQSKFANVEVMNAGVAGYGPVDALNLLEFLEEEGYRFDLVVYNMFTENDYTDNLPQTERRVVGGMIFRFPHSWFLRTIHPTNSYLFRYVLVIWKLSTLPEEASSPISFRSGKCVFSREDSTEVSSFLKAFIRERLEGNRMVAQSERAKREVMDAISAMKACAGRLDIPFIIAVFPDRVLVDGNIRQQLHIEYDKLWPLKDLQTLLYRTFSNTPVVSVENALQGLSGMYRWDDTHLSDLGNVTAGSYVAEKLVEFLARSTSVQLGSGKGH